MIFDTKIYIYGGFKDTSLNDLYSINLMNLVWTKETQSGTIPPLLRGFSFVRVGTKLFITGGCDFEAKKCFTDTYYLETKTLWWTKILDSNRYLFCS